jgi:hypothetical protein
MGKEKKGEGLALVEFQEAMERSNVDKFTDQMLAGLSDVVRFRRGC